MNRNKHILYIADAKKASTFISPYSIDLVITGPPYWNEVIYSNQPEQLSAIDDYNQFLAEIGRVWHECAKLLKPGAILAFWVHDLYRKDENGREYIPLHADLTRALPNDVKLRQISIWDRYLSRIRPYMPAKEGAKYQYIIICQKQGAHSGNQELISKSLVEEFWTPVWHFKTTPKILGSRLLFKLTFKTFAPFSDKLKFLKERGRNLLQDNYRFNEYKTTCPPEVAERLITKFSRTGDVVLDPFLGSGTTMAVADKLNRKCIGIEINPEVVPIVQKKVGEDRLELIWLQRRQA